jgi:predicted TIM-barrel fold metal-dependent hydrolase
MIVDTHLHLIDKQALTYPWLGDAPGLNRDHLYAEYALEAARCGIAGTLHMEVDVEPGLMQAETDYVRTLSGEAGSLLRGAIAACRPEDEGFTAYLETAKADPLVRGFRRVLHGLPDAVPQSAVYRDNLRRMQGSRLTYDLIFQGHRLKQAIELADAAPDLQFVLDHFGSPDLKGGRDNPWWADIADLAKRPNVAAKISGIIAYTDPQGWTVASLRPFFDHVTGHFGWDRVVWGSDWPVCNLGGGLGQWVAATHALLAGASERERTALLEANARRIWKL